MRIRHLAAVVVAAIALSFAGAASAAFAGVPTATINVANPTLRSGTSSIVLISFSEPVTGLTSADFTADNAAVSNVSTFNGGTSWTAQLTPFAGVTDSSNVITLDLTGVSSRSTSQPGVGSATSNNYSVDTVAPTLVITADTTTLRAGQTASLTFTFSEVPSGFTASDIGTTNGTLGSFSATADPRVYTGVFTPAAGLGGDTGQVSVAGGLYTDAAGNSGTAANSPAIAIDTIAPTATVTVSDSSLTTGETAVVTITFSEAISSLDLTDLTAESADLSGLATTDNVTFTATLTPMVNFLTSGNSVTLYLTRVQDTFGNPGIGTAASTSYSVNTVQAALMITVVDDTLTEGETSVVKFDFSRPVLGFSNANVTVQNGTLSTMTTTDGGLTFRAILTPTPGLNAPSNVITADLAGVTDEAGNPTQSRLYSSNVYRISTVAPSALAATGIEPIGALVLALMLLVVGVGAARVPTRRLPFRSMPQ